VCGYVRALERGREIENLLWSCSWTFVARDEDTSSCRCRWSSSWWPSHSSYLLHDFVRDAL